jgi:gamma-glutamylcyclotransferase (GGCT)/AIG2-like uncharacterized protein YtfP
MSRIVVYGSLREKQPAAGTLHKCKKLGEVRLPGYDMYALTWFPGVVPNPDNKEGVVCELYEGVDDKLLSHLDCYEGYFPHNLERSLFRREEVEVVGPEGFTNAYLYVFNRNPYEAFGTSARVVRSGDWVQYRGEE